MNLSQGDYVALAYGVAFAVVLFYVAIIAAKLARLERDTAGLVEEVLARRERAPAGAVEMPDYAGASWEGSIEARRE